jgi:thiamine biosynthesis protein ThiI
MKYIIRPFAEIIVKSKPVRKRYLDFLQNNANLTLKRVNENLKVKLFWDKLELDTTILSSQVRDEEIVKVLSRIP